MTAHAFVRQVQDALAPLADPERAVPMAAYMRDRFPFLGISTPLRRQAVAPVLRQRLAPEELIPIARSLWALPEREFQYVAVDLLARQWKSLALEDVEALLALAQEKSWWDTVDALAGVTGDIIRAARRTDPDVQTCMDAALAHPNLWVRRIAMLHQLGWRGETDTERLFGYATRLAPEPDFFIRKAIGWALRDYARHDPEGVKAFLEANRTGLSPLSLREAGKHLSPL